jgi:hypothetical protein
VIEGLIIVFAKVSYELVSICTFKLNAYGYGDRIDWVLHRGQKLTGR